MYDHFEHSLSLADPPYAGDTYVVIPPGDTPTNTLTVFLFLYVENVASCEIGSFGFYWAFRATFNHSCRRKFLLEICC